MTETAEPVLEEPKIQRENIHTDLSEIPTTNGAKAVSATTKKIAISMLVASSLVLCAGAITAGVLLTRKSSTTVTYTTATTTTSVTTTTTATTTTTTTATTTTPTNAPTNMISYAGNTYQNYTFILTGTNSGGSLWGTTIYTHDSNLATAAVHAGVLASGQTRTVVVIMLPGQSSYTGSTQNGVTSNSYGSWSNSYRFV